MNPLTRSWLTLACLLGFMGGSIGQGQTIVEVSTSISLDTKAGGKVLLPPVVSTLAWNERNRILATGGDDHVVRLWNLDEGTLIQQWEGHTDWIRAVVFNSNGNLLISAGDDAQIRYYDVTQGIETGVTGSNLQAVFSLASHPQENLIAVAGLGEVITIYDVDKKIKTAELEPPCDEIRTVTYSPDGSRLASAGRNGIIRLWNTEDGAVIADIPTDRQRIRTLTFSPDGTRLAAAGDGRRVHVIDLSTQQSLFSLPNRPGRIMSMLFLEQDQVVVGSSDNAIRIWDLNTQEETIRLIGHMGSVTSLAWDGAQGKLISTGYDTSVRQWELSGALRGNAREASQPEPNTKLK